MTDCAAPAIASPDTFVPLVPGAFLGAERIVECLVNHGVEHVFIFPAAPSRPFSMSSRSKPP